MHGKVRCPVRTTAKHPKSTSRALLQFRASAGACVDDEADEEEWDIWDVQRSLFDNHMSPSFEANMEYMFKKFGFYFPDAEFLVDPEGLLQYLVNAPSPPSLCCTNPLSASLHLTRSLLCAKVYYNLPSI